MNLLKREDQDTQPMTELELRQVSGRNNPMYVPSPLTRGMPVASHCSLAGIWAGFACNHLPVLRSNIFHSFPVIPRSSQHVTT